MSWTYDFGVHESADSLADHEPDLSMPVEDKQAVADHLDAAKRAAALVMRSKAFGDAPVRVQASGMALPGHRPYGGKVRKVRFEKYGREVEGESILESAALEGITITLTQMPPEDFGPEVVGDGTS